jgi:hypothetical protein
MTTFERGCEAGYFMLALSGAEKCVPCDPGTYNTATVAFECTACAAGTYAIEYASTVCTACAAGSAQTGSGRKAACQGCAPGSAQSLTGQSECVTCLAGTYAPTTGASECIQCSQGKYQTATGSTQNCEKCAVGWYASAQGQSVCASCPDGKTTTQNGSMGVQQCVVCQVPGFWIDNATRACVECPSGYFCKGDGTRTPRRVGEDGKTYIKTIGESWKDNTLAACTLCVEGQTYETKPCGETTDRQCGPCDTARLPTSFVQVPCTLIANTKIGPCTDADLDPGQRCNPCPAGTTYNPTTPGRRCVLCPNNTFKAEAGNGTCVACDIGKQSVAGAWRCTTRCDAGTVAFNGDACVPLKERAPWRTRVQVTASLGTPKALAVLTEGLWLVLTVEGRLWRVDPEEGGAWLVAGGSNADLGGGARPALVAQSATVLLHSDFGPAVRRLAYHPQQERWAVTQLGGTFERAMGLAAMKDNGALVADWSAHCVWWLTPTLGRVVWRGIQGEAGSMLGWTLPADATGELDAYTETRLANPSLVGYYDANTPAFVLDARALWAFDMVGGGPSSEGGETPNLALACGGGATALSGSGGAALACVNANLGGSNVTGMVMGHAGGAPALFLLSSNAGVWVLGLRVTNLRALTLRALPLPTTTTVMGLANWWNGRLLGVTADWQIVECGISAVTQLDPTFEGGCLCDAGLYCVEGQCVVVPAGKVSPAWTATAVECPAGTLFDHVKQTCEEGNCASPEQFTTQTVGALVCERRCAAGQRYYNGECRSGCNATEYLHLDPKDPAHGTCLKCPLGTSSVGGQTTGILNGCVACAPGKYGVAPGVCAECESNVITRFAGATRCLPCGLGQEKGSDGKCVACTLNCAVANACRDFDGLDGACAAEPVRVMNATAAGFSITSSGQIHYIIHHTNSSTTNPTPPVLEVSDDDGRMRFEARGTCVYRDGVVWVGDCNKAGHTNGARSMGVATLGTIVEMALMAIDGATPVLFLSTMLNGCASVRAASLFDGTLTTFVGSDAVSMPTVLYTPESACPKTPYRLAVARGYEELVLASGSRVWRLSHVLTRPIVWRPDAPLFTLSETVTAVCRRGAHLLVVATAETVQLMNATDTFWNARTLLGSGANDVRQLGCAGRHVWWRNGSGIYQAGVGQLWNEGCMGGYASDGGGGCAQVGLGMFTTTGDALSECKAGTRGVVAGAATSAIACEPCPLGAVASSRAFGCAFCPFGKYALGDTCVATCTGGYRPSSQGASCVECPSGSMPSSTGECEPCRAGFYANATTGGVCAACPMGTTSIEGAFRCVRMCDVGTCAPTGDECLPVAQDWRVMTSVQLGQGRLLQAVAVGAGGTLFFTDGTELYYYYDEKDCDADAGCQTPDAKIERLLPTLPCRTCVRGLSALALAAKASPIDPGMRLLYATSFSTHSVYRFPIYFKEGSSVEVDVDRTRQVLASGNSSLYVRGVAGDSITGLEGWRLTGGRRAFADGDLASARFDTPSELELTSDDTLLYVSDFLNHRIRQVNLTAGGKVTTLLGRGVSQWSYGPLDEASASLPMGIGRSPDEEKLYVAQYFMDSVGALHLGQRTFDQFCSINAYDKSLDQTCQTTTGGDASCMLFRPFDVLASADGRLFVATTNGLTMINQLNGRCDQVAGAYWDLTAKSAGFYDGARNPTTLEPESLLSRPTKLALDPQRGILYLADLGNSALRRVFVAGECRCAEGSLFISGARSCFNPTPFWDTRRPLLQCPPGEYALEGGSACLSCASGATASACLLHAVRSVALGRILSDGLSYAQVLGAMEPKGAPLSDWYGVEATLPTGHVWNEIFREASPVRYVMGAVAGRVPGGGEFVSLRWNPNGGRWAVDRERTPRRLAPGFWYPCGRVVSINPGYQCECTTIVTAFAETYGRNRWYDLRADAALNGGRALGRRLDLTDATRIGSWSRFMGMLWADGRAAVLEHYTTSIIPALAGVIQTSAPRTLTTGSSVKPSRCVTGWVAHYACPDGYVWVAPNTTALAPDQLLASETLTGAIACLSCLPGTFSKASLLSANGGGPYECVPCRPGHFARGVGSTRCEACPVGTYASAPGSTGCTACPLNHYTLYGGASDSNQCSPCPPGTGGCVHCVPGEWQNRSAQDVCQACLPGTFSNQSNATECVACAAGKYQASSGQGVCEACPASYYATPDRTGCLECLAECNLVIDGVCGAMCGLNQYYDSNARECRRCPKGSMNGLNVCAREATDCNNWRPGHFVDDANGTHPIQPCPPGTGPNANLDGCVPCAAGEAATTAGDGCVKCRAGLFGNASGRTSCDACPKGHYTAESGQTVCIACEAGKASATEGALECAPCTPGTYASQTGRLACVPCASGTASNTTGRITECPECNEADNLYSAMGAKACVKCVGGIANATTCVGCGWGHYAEDNGCKKCEGEGLVQRTTQFATSATQCTQCGTSTFAVTVNGEPAFCEQASPGYEPYNPTNALGPPTAQRQCEAGTYRGLDEYRCTACPAGMVAQAAGATTCVSCPVGKYRPASVSGRVCRNCMVGTIAADMGASECEQCAAGKAPASTMDRCFGCEPGTYSESGRRCDVCAPGKTSAANASVCVWCPPWTIGGAQGTCVECAAGRYMVAVVMPSEDRVAYACERCPEGTYNPQAGAINATACNTSACWPRSYAPNAQRTGCAPCDPGHATTDGRLCVACPPGTYSEEGTGCAKCGLHTYASAMGQTSCTACEAGRFANVSGAVECAPCPAGTYSSTKGADCVACARDHYMASTGATACVNRTVRCATGQFVVGYEGNDGTRDNECHDCPSCGADQYAIIVPSGDGLWTVVGSQNGEAVGVLDEQCPGDRRTVGYTCRDNAFAAGKYLESLSSAMVGSNGITPEGLVTVNERACDWLTPKDATCVDYARMAYVTGNLPICYVGCRYGIDETAVRLYEYDDKVEAPYSNVFRADQAVCRLNQSSLCLPCPQGVCEIVGRYRPYDAGQTTCGPSCMLRADGCKEPDGRDNQGCIGQCTGLPANAYFVGGAAQMNGSDQCPFACLGSPDGVRPGYHLSDDGRACLLCGTCPGGPQYVPLTPCLPHQRTRDVCRLCAEVEGGVPTGVNATTGQCTYACQRGYYHAAENAMQPCRRCDALNEEACPMGTFRNVTACASEGIAPPCAPCSLPVDLGRLWYELPTRADRARLVTFHSAGIPAAEDRCNATCNVGLHSRVKSTGAYVSTAVSVHDLQCVPCGSEGTATLTCHGTCSVHQYRDQRVTNGLTDGACKPCTRSADCPRLGYYAPQCSGNGTGDVACQPCDERRLYDGSERTRAFVPYGVSRNAIATVVALPDGACPMACLPNRVRDPVTGACVRCGAPAEECAAQMMPPGQPTPCDFMWAHWNASNGPMWWAAASTPPFLRGLRPLEDGVSYIRAGRCWACPYGWGVRDKDVCELLPGFGAASEERRLTVRVPIPTRAQDVVFSMREPRRYALSRGNPIGQRRRRLLTVSANSSSSSTSLAVAAPLAKLAPLPVGYYNDGSSPYTLSCPSGMSTRTTGSVNVRACECLPGHSNTSGRCEPCPPNTYRSVLMPVAEGCVACAPGSETTFGLEGQSACACAPGWVRGGNGLMPNACAPCPANHFCLPCTDAVCPPFNTWVVPCMAGGTAPPGSASLLNCTCPQQERLLRPRYTKEQLQNAPSNAGLYCAPRPPNTYYDAQTLTVRCLPGWTAVYAPGGTKLLVGCQLCGQGMYAARTPMINQSTPTCLKCPIGTYMERTDAIGGCDACEGRQTTLGDGTTSAAGCTCPRGTRRDPNTQRCVGCALGEYATADRMGCEACPAGKTSFVGASNATDCVCDPGSYATGGGLCAPCPKGAFAATAGMARCTSCGAHRTTAGEGARSTAACFCEPGYVTVSGVLCVDSALFFVIA